MKKLIFTLMLWLPIASAWAVKLSSLYQAEIPVASQSDADKTQAVRAGLLQVLVKLSGNSQLEKNPIIKAELKSADHLVEEFRYATPTAAVQYMLQVNYDANAVNQLLKRAGIAYWGETRPLILVWMAVAAQQQPADIIGDESPGDVLDAMKRVGKANGLPLIFPNMDVADINLVSVNDIQAMTSAILQQAGKRYSPDAILIGNMQQDSDGYKSHWRLVLDNKSWDFTAEDKTTNGVIENVLAQVGQALAQHYVVKVSDTANALVTLYVGNITQRDDLTQLMTYLKQMTQVQQVQLAEVSQDAVLLSLQVRGTLASFEKNASIGQHLILKTQDQANGKLFYDWVR